MDTKRHDKLLRSDTTTTSTENSEANKPSNTGAVGESSGTLELSSLSGVKLEKESHKECTDLESSKYLRDEKTKDEEFMVDDNNAEALSKTLSNGISVSNHESKVSLSNSQIMDANATNESSDPMENSDIKLKTPLVGETVGAPNSVLESMQVDMQLENGENEMILRLAASKKRARSLSPGTDINNGEKRSAAVCSFYAKGWCIKGSSCSFLHIKDDMSNSDQHPDEDVGTAHLKKQAHLNEGQKYSADTLKSPVVHQPLDSSFINGSSFSSKFDDFLERGLPRNFTENQGWDELHDRNKFLLRKREDSLLSALPDCQKLSSANFGPSFPTNRGNHTLRNDFLPETGLSSGGFARLFGNHSSGTPSSRFGVMEKLSNVANDHSPILRTSLDSKATLPISGLLSSRFSSCNSSSYPFTSSSLSASVLGTQKMSIFDREHHASKPASLMRNSSPFSASKSDNSLKSSEYKMKHSSYDWEPSIPFRPSFLIPSINAASQYDPFLDSIEVPRKVGGSYNASFNRQGHEEASTPSSLQRALGNFRVPGSSAPEINDDTSSLSSHNKANENKDDKTCNVHGKALPTVGEETQRSHGIDVHNGGGTRELLGLAHERTIMKTKKLDADSELPNVALHEKDSEADSERRPGDLDAKHLMDGDLHKESKVFRHFRAALIEFVKELLKPKWREGHLKKEVHNTVVKKVLDKVLGSLQSHQIPTSVESIKQYLSSSRPKIAKLVEGYVSKYGKS